MTIVVAVKIFDGIVLAADSAATMMLQNGTAHVYNHANKLFQLHRALPIGAATWGLGQLGTANIATLTKDLRRRLMGEDGNHRDWKLQAGHTVEGVAERLIELMYDELYAPIYAGIADPPALGFLVAGYSDGATDSELWTIDMTDPTQRPSPLLYAAPNSVGSMAFAQAEAFHRLTLGVSPELLTLLQSLVAPPLHGALQMALHNARWEPVTAAMPLQDAISLAQFLVSATVGFQHYALGPDTVGGPIDTLAISRHEGLKWITRKHYYSPELNPRYEP